MTHTFHKTAIHAMALSAVYALASGCTIQTVHPLHESGSIVRDDQILGVWMPVDSVFEKSDVRIEISLDEQGRYQVRELDEDDPLVLTGYLVDLGDHRYLELQNSSTVDKLNPGVSTQVDTHIFAKVALKEDLLSVSYPNRSQIKRAISAGELDGIVGYKTFYDPIVLTSSADKLQDFFDRNPESAFCEPELFRRVEAQALNKE